MARPYATLRALIKANDETNAYLAERVLNKRTGKWKRARNNHQNPHEDCDGIGRNDR